MWVQLQAEQRAPAAAMPSSVSFHAWKLSIHRMLLGLTLAVHHTSCVHGVHLGLHCQLMQHAEYGILPGAAGHCAARSRACHARTI